VSELRQSCLAPSTSCPRIHIRLANLGRCKDMATLLHSRAIAPNRAPFLPSSPFTTLTATRYHCAHNRIHVNGIVTLILVMMDVGSLSALAPWIWKFTALPRASHSFGREDGDNVGRAVREIGRVLRQVGWADDMRLIFGGSS
jgi:hypothetical protein